MIRRHALPALAVLVVGLLVSAPAEAGGTIGAVGVRKEANVIIKNTTKSPYYVFLIPAAIGGSDKFGTPGTVGWSRKLGGVIVNPGTSVVYPVPAGPGGIMVYKPSDVPPNQNAFLPDDPNIGAPATGGEYTAPKGSRITKTIKAGPVLE